MVDGGFNAGVLVRASFSFLGKECIIACLFYKSSREHLKPKIYAHAGRERSNVMPRSVWDEHGISRM